MAFIMQLLYTEMYAARPVMDYYDIFYNHPTESVTLQNWVFNSKKAFLEKLFLFLKRN